MSPTALHNKIKSNLESPEDISIVELVDSLVEHAHTVRASDIRVTPTEKHIRIRFRIDGVLHDMFEVPLRIHQEIVARIKILSRLRTDEHQAAQDGRFRISLDKAGPVDIRVSISPTYHGENAVLRILADKEEQFSLESLGFSKGDQEKIMKAIKRPSGMILSTGPTGSGKTTTLYTIIKMLNSPDTSIITLEDPIEYAIGGIEQIQINPRTNLTFSNGLRSVLRQDPDTIMVGEIRDTETAGLAVNTALTGHLLLSTLHTTDSATTLPRLLDMGIEPYLVASTVNVVLGQRLVRRTCDNCKEIHNLSELEMKSIEGSLPKGTLKKEHGFVRGKGCDVCNDTGYIGRIGINEVLIVDEEIREAFLRRASASDIKQIAMKNGMTSMLQDGFNKATEGVTTIDEVLRVVYE